MEKIDEQERQHEMELQEAEIKLAALEEKELELARRPSVRRSVTVLSEKEELEEFQRRAELEAKEELRQEQIEHKKIFTQNQAKRMQKKKKKAAPQKSERQIKQQLENTK